MRRPEVRELASTWNGARRKVAGTSIMRQSGVAIYALSLA
jgi:hypothetical protein